MFSGKRIKALEEESQSENTRKEKRALLGFSVLAFIMRFASLIPEKISALGIDLSVADKKNLKLVLVIVLIYFLWAFLVYGLQDWLAWRGKIFETLSAEIKAFYEPSVGTKGARFSGVESYTPGKPLWQKAWKMLPKGNTIKYSYRIYHALSILEFFFPLGVGLVALFCAAGIDAQPKATNSYVPIDLFGY